MLAETNASPPEAAHNDPVAPEHALATLREVSASEQLTAARVDGGTALESRVAVLPASFNPPTLAHLELLAESLEVPGVASTAFLLSTRNVDKQEFGAGYADRLGMLLSLGPAAPVVLISNAARIADQAVAIRHAFPGLDFDFVVGYDTLLRLFDRRYYDAMHEVLGEFFTHHRLIAANRGAHDVAAVERYLAADPDAARYRDSIIVAEVHEEAALMSSSLVRSHLALEGASPHLPREVARYIRAHGLYREGT
jgi:nicotinic acid mononucleotide adenylyltransferase